MIIHISGALAMTAPREMWELLASAHSGWHWHHHDPKEIQRSLVAWEMGTLATRRESCRTTTAEGFYMVEHILNLRKLQDSKELHFMENKVRDDSDHITTGIIMTE